MTDLRFWTFSWNWVEIFNEKFPSALFTLKIPTKIIKNIIKIVKKSWNLLKILVQIIKIVKKIGKTVAEVVYESQINGKNYENSSESQKNHLKHDEHRQKNH